MAEPVSLALQAMGCRFELVLKGTDSARLRGAGEAALAEVARLHRLLTRFEPESDVARLNQHGARNPVRIDAELGALLVRCVELSSATDGAFDITVGGQLAGTDTARLGSAGLLVAENLRSAGLAREGMAIDLGGIGKGYALDVVAEVLEDAGVTSAFGHAGTSSILAVGSPPDQPLYRVAIAPPPSGAPRRGAIHCARANDAPGLGRAESHPYGEHEKPSTANAPLAYRKLGDEAMAVSGRIMSGLEHLLDPRTGESITGALLAAVVHPSATVADALATALVVDGDSLWSDLPGRFPQAEALLVTEGPASANRIRTLGTWEVL